MRRGCSECGHDITGVSVEGGMRLCGACGGRTRGVKAAFGMVGALRRAVARPLLWGAPVLALACMPLVTVKMEERTLQTVMSVVFCLGTVHAGVQVGVVVWCWPRTLPRRGRWLARAGVLAGAAVVWVGVWVVLVTAVMEAGVLSRLGWVLWGD